MTNQQNNQAASVKVAKKTITYMHIYVGNYSCHSPSAECFQGILLSEYKSLT